MTPYSHGFEEDHRLRSAFIRGITLQQPNRSLRASAGGTTASMRIPRTLVRYWHDPNEIPDDVLICLNSWNRLQEEGFAFQMFDDALAAAYIANRYGTREVEAFGRCRHPAMRSDYLRMCFLLAEGGLYVDADDVLLNDGWKCIFQSGRLKVQPLCYDIATGKMLPAADIWRSDLLTDGRTFYVNNDPIAAPPGHPLLQRALARSTTKLLGGNPLPEIQETTGPGNLSAALAAHAYELTLTGAIPDFELLLDWEAIAETRWNLSYRGDARNWRNMGTG